ncbi:hypothetical protein BJY52DRAFT_1231487 [Lactarius psammicola]|nr:hypothetical protein BJY52DRAFT_1231487 [Lactarius psammicola]
MQSDNGSQPVSGGSQLSSTAPATAPAHPIDDVFEITQEDASILEEYIEEFKGGRTAQARGPALGKEAQVGNGGSRGNWWASALARAERRRGCQNVIGYSAWR